MMAREGAVKQTGIIDRIIKRYNNRGTKVSQEDLYAVEETEFSTPRVGKIDQDPRLPITYLPNSIESSWINIENWLWSELIKSTR